MRNLRWMLLSITLFINGWIMAQAPFGIVIHGGAGNGIEPGRFTAEQEQAYRAGLARATMAGYTILENGGSAEDAVVAAIKVLEDDSLFNAGVGAVMTAEGKVEHDASLMHGTSKAAGAVAGVTTVRHPIAAAQAVMRQSPHVMLVGDGAEKFAHEQGLTMVENSFFYTQKRVEQYQRAKARHANDERGHHSVSEDFKFGTVGAVALDREGNIVAGTSTGGMTYKLYGRVGDSPIIGAGTYADSQYGGISATGHGEYFMRYVVAYDIIARLKYRHTTLAQAAQEVINQELKAVGGDGGVIGMNPNGEVIMVFNTNGMFRASKTMTTPLEVLMYKEE